MSAHTSGRATPDTPIPGYWPLILAWTVSLSFQPWASFSLDLCSDCIWTEAILIKKHLDVHELCPKSPACTYCCRSPSHPGTRPSRRCPCPRCIENIGLEDGKKYGIQFSCAPKLIDLLICRPFWHLYSVWWHMFYSFAQDAHTSCLDDLIKGLNPFIDIIVAFKWTQLLHKTILNKCSTKPNLFWQEFEPRSARTPDNSARNLATVTEMVMVIFRWLKVDL